MLNPIRVLVDTLVNLPAPDFWYTTCVPFLEQNHIINSRAITGNLYNVICIALFYHACFLMGQKVIFPGISNWRVNLDAKKQQTTSSTSQKEEEEEKEKEEKNSSSSNNNNRESLDKRAQKLTDVAAMRLVSLIQTAVVLYLSFNCLLDPKYTETIYPNAHARIFGESRDSQLVCIFATGYFIWDAYISFWYSTFAFVCHGIFSTTSYMIGLTPYIQYYAPIFMVFELSNPFLNFRWFATRFFPPDNKVLAIVRTANDLAFITVFAFARIVWGFYQLYRLASDFYTVREDPRFRLFETLGILVGNAVINVLNVMWFSTMVSIAINYVFPSPSPASSPSSSLSKPKGK